MIRDRLWQAAFVVLAAAAAAGGAFLQGPLRAERQRLQLDTVTADPSLVKDPKTVLLQLAPGGLRAPFINYLWIRSQELKQEGKFFDAKQQRDLICALMPHFPGVWSYCAWDMAWNISVDTHTPQERWMWVHNAITLLRDRGLYYNPDDLILYKELGWIFFSKMGQYTDEMHLAYKQRWAAMMHRVLGSPPTTGRTEDAVAAFQAIAQAPSSLEELARDPEARAFLAALAPLEVRADERFLDLYNRFSGDPLVASAQFSAGRPADPRQGQIAELMGSVQHAPGRARVLAFVRKKVLTEQYRLDTDWMLKLMEKYGPLDWRSAVAHGLYWSTLGLHRVEGLDLNYIHALNTDRITLDTLQMLTRIGLMYYTPDLRRAEEPLIDWAPDWRFIEPTHQEYLTAGTLLAGADKLDTEQNALRDAHINFLANAIEQLYIGNREDLARHYYQEMKRLLKPAGQIYELDVDEFVRAKLRQSGTPPADMARAFWYGGMLSAYRALAGGDQNGYIGYLAFARKAYETFRQDTGQSDRFKSITVPFDEQERNFLVGLLTRPASAGVDLPLLAKVRLYGGLEPAKQQAVYPFLTEPLREQCRNEQIDFDKAFPPPPGYRPPPATAAAPGR